MDGIQALTSRNISPQWTELKVDGGTLCCSLENLAATLAIIEDEGLAQGLHLNRSKSLIHSIADTPVNNPN